MLGEGMMLDLIKVIRSKIQDEYTFTGIIDDETEHLAKLHDVTPFIYDQDQDRNKLLMIIARMMKIDYAAEEMLAILEEAEIKHIPLKGAVIRSLYPQFWMRTSCDIDILIQEKDLNRAVDAFVSRGYHTDGKKSYHDISLFSQDGIHLELHFNICENIEKMDRVLEKIWDYTVLQDGYSFRYKETEEFFLFHHIAHMAYHFQGGGCGIRPFVDLWLINKYYEIDEHVYHKLLREAELETFEKNAMKLMRYWFDDGDTSELILQMENYILHGGVYGSNKQSILIKQNKIGGKLNYFLYRVFMPYESMVILYPILKKNKLLLPICEVHRWIRAFKVKDRIVKETKIAIKSEVDYSVYMMKELGL